MTFNFETRQRGGITILDVHGGLVLGKGDAELRDQFDTLIAAGQTRFILNLEDVTQVDSTGLGTLAFTQARLKQMGGKLVLLHPRQAHMELLVYVKMEATFGVFTEEQEAVNSFFPDRAVRRFDILSFVESLKHHSDANL